MNEVLQDISLSYDKLQHHLEMKFCECRQKDSRFFHDWIAPPIKRCSPFSHLLNLNLAVGLG